MSRNATRSATFDVEEGTLYIQSLYFSYVAMAGVGVGDLVPVRTIERLFFAFISLVSIVSLSLIFGNMALLVDDLAPKLK